MKCEVIREKLIEYYYRELPSDTGKVVSQHLEQCQSCIEYYNGLSGMLNTLKLKEPEMPERVWSDLRRRVFSRIDRAQSKRIFIFRPVPAFATALLLMVILFGGIRYFDSKQTQNFIAQNYGLLQNLELYENLELFEYLEDIELLEQI